MTLHVPVLKEELRRLIQPARCQYIVDCTAGYGGHMAALMELAPEQAVFFGIDRDPNAVNHLKKRFASEITSGRVVILHSPFSKIADLEPIHALKGKISAIYADLGVSSPQLDDADRGFSFGKDAPLDMRMDQTSEMRDAKAIVNEATAQELTHIFQNFGEEPKARAVANAIIRAREKQPISSTVELANLVAGAIKYKTKSRVHPATRIFQALRIVVNDELGEIERFLQQALPLLDRGGRLAVISFHSLEDRLVKTAFRSWENNKTEDFALARLPIRQTELDRGKQVEVLKPFPIIPSETECAENARARSAKLRVLEKL